MTSYTCNQCKTEWTVLAAEAVKLPYICPRCNPDNPFNKPPPNPDHQARIAAGIDRLVAIGEKLLAHLGLCEGDYKARLEEVRDRKPE